MFANRLRLVAAGAALVMSASLTGVASSATAEPAAAPAAKETRTVKIKGVEPRPNVFYVKGRVFPAYEKRPGTVQRKVRGSKWKTYKRFKTSAKSRYRVRVAPLRHRGKVYYRVKIAGNKKFKNAFSDTLYIRTY